LYVGEYWDAHVRNHEHALESDLDRLLLNKNLVRDTMNLSLLLEMDFPSLFKQGPPLACFAAAFGLKKCVRRLLDREADPVGLPIDESGATALHWAANRGHMSVVCDLLVWLPVNAIDRNGQTALHLAAARNHVEVVRELLSAGAFVTIRDNEENTPLHLATFYNCQKVVDELKPRMESGEDLRREAISLRNTRNLDSSVAPGD
jgi:ankyrin repeat protein